MNRNTTLGLMKYSAVTIAGLMVAGIATVMFLARGTGEDITGVVAPALLVAFVSAAVAGIAWALQKRGPGAAGVK